MPLVTSQEILHGARRGGYAVAGFAAYNMETVQAVVEVAEELQAPVFIQTTPATIRSSGIRFLHAIVKAAADGARVPVVLHLDHGESYEQVIECLRHGYTSVMIDGSRYAFADNVALVREAVRSAHAVGVPVEAELGRVGGVEDDLSVDAQEAAYTDPEEARRFVELTGVDSLAVAIGTAHGWYHGEPNLDLQRLEHVAAQLSADFPLVLHGASGLHDAQIKQTIVRGISKFNIATELKMPFAKALRDYFCANPTGIDPRTYFPQAKEAYKAVVREKILLSGSQGRALSL
ncbi:MAG: ketose-bisphosphate aldolase [Alicyclobacillus sp.]|nr:ketose-bisphosphate aldolase [Alicyclobacillus sp.]